MRLDSLSLRESFLKLDPNFVFRLDLSSPTAAKAQSPPVPPGKGPAKPRPGKAGDILSALMGVPSVKQAVDNVKENAANKLRRDWNRLSAGEKAGTISTAVLITGGALAGVILNDQARREALEFVQGKNIPVPGVTGLTFSISPVGKDKKFMVNFDLAQFIRSRGK